MTTNVSARNERRNRRRAMTLTFLITSAAVAGVLYAGNPEWQLLIDHLIAEVLGTSPQAEVQP